jgi:hypothetical protein
MKDLQINEKAAEVTTAGQITDLPAMANENGDNALKVKAMLRLQKMLDSKAENDLHFKINLHLPTGKEDITIGDTKKINRFFNLWCKSDLTEKQYREMVSLLPIYLDEIHDRLQMFINRGVVLSIDPDILLLIYHFKNIPLLQHLKNSVEGNLILLKSIEGVANDHPAKRIVDEFQIHLQQVNSNILNDISENGHDHWDNATLKAADNSLSKLIDVISIINQKLK